MTFLYFFMFLCFACIFGYFIYDYGKEYKWLDFLLKLRFFSNLNDFVIYLFKFWITVFIFSGGLFFLFKVLEKVLVSNC